MSKIEELIKEKCPDGVKYKRIEDVCVFIDGYPFKRAELGDSGIPVIRTSDLGNGRIVVDNALKYPGKGKLNKYFTQVGDILIGMSGTIKIARCLSRDRYLINQRVGIFRTREGIMISDFLFFLLTNNLNDLYAMSGAGTVKNLSKVLLMNYLVPVPPLEVQHEIIGILNSFTRLETELETELEARKQQYEYYRDNLLSFDNLTSGGGYKQLGRICKIETGKLNANDAVENGKYKFFTTAKEVSYTDTYRWDTESLLIAGNANVGDVKHYKGKFNAYQRTYVLSDFDKSVIPRFLYFSLKSNLKRYVEKHKNKAAMTYIVLSTLENFEIFIPPKDIQEKIVYVMDDFDAVCNDLNIGLPAEIEARQKQYEYYRDKLLSFD